MTRTGAAATLAAAGIGADVTDAMLNVAEQLGEVTITRIDPPADITLRCTTSNVGPWFYVGIDK